MKNVSSDTNQPSMQVFTVNDDGVVLLPDYMAKAVMSKDDDITEVTEVEDKNTRKHQQHQ